MLIDVRIGLTRTTYHENSWHTQFVRNMFATEENLNAI